MWMSVRWTALVTGTLTASTVRARLHVNAVLDTSCLQSCVLVSADQGKANIIYIYNFVRF